MKYIALIIVACLALLGAQSAKAVPTGGSDTTHGVVPGVFDPDSTGCPTAEWTLLGLDLHKLCDTSTNAAAGGDVVGFNDQKLEQLSFDIKNGSHIGAGSPRFDVLFTDDTFRIFVANYGLATDLEDGWTHYEFNDQTPFCDFASSEPETCGFNGAGIAGIDVLLDEEGVAVLRNISVNGIVMNSAPTPPQARPSRDGYCTKEPFTRADGTKGLFADLEFGQPSVDPAWQGATPAYYVAGIGETCLLPAGAVAVAGVTVNVNGEAGGIHPYYKKG